MLSSRSCFAALSLSCPKGRTSTTRRCICNSWYIGSLLCFTSFTLFYYVDKGLPPELYIRTPFGYLMYVVPALKPAGAILMMCLLLYVVYTYFAHCTYCIVPRTHYRLHMYLPCLLHVLCAGHMLHVAYTANCFLSVIGRYEVWVKTAAGPKGNTSITRCIFV